MSLYRVRLSMTPVLDCGRCLYKAVKPFRTFMDNVVAGTQLPVEPPDEKPQDDSDDFVPQVLIAHR